MSTCRGCSCPLVWAKRPNGKNIPLNPIADLAELMERCALEVPDPLPAAHRYFVKHGEAVQHPDGDHLSHFIVCPDRAKF